MDDLARALLKLEIERPGISSSDMICELGLDVDRKTVDNRRRLPEFQAALRAARNLALEELKDAQLKAVRKLKELIDDENPAIALAASKVLAEATIKAAAKAAEIEAENSRIKNIETTVVEVVLPDNLPIIGESYVDEQGQVKRLPKIKPEITFDETQKS